MVKDARMGCVPPPFFENWLQDSTKRISLNGRGKCKGVEVVEAKIERGREIFYSSCSAGLAHQR